MLLAQPYLSRFNPQIDLHYFAGYIGYLVLGHYLAFKEFPARSARIWSGLIFLLTLTIIVAGTYYMCQYTKAFSTLLYEPLSPAIVLLSSSVFLFARFTAVKLPPALKKARDFISAYTFGIYLSHALLLDIIGDPDNHLNINWQLCNPAISIPVTAIVCYILSLLLVYLISKIPLGKWVAM
jgi:surface polysaccharide O-acyltransferase-like enzyme